MIGITLIACGVYATTGSIVTSLPIVGGIIACGVTLIIIAILGIMGAVKHHQVMLFFVSFFKQLHKLLCESVLFPVFLSVKFKRLSLVCQFSLT